MKYHVVSPDRIVLYSGTLEDCKKYMDECPGSSLTIVENR